MKSLTLTAVLAALLLAGAAQASSGHYIRGMEGLEAATLPPPGFYYRMHNMFYNASTVKNARGDTMNIDFKLRPFIQIHNFIASTNKTIFGARYGYSLAVPLIHNDVNVGKTFRGERFPDFWNFHNLGEITVGRKEHSFGVSDIEIEPIILSWSGDRYEIRADLGVFAPTGRYSENDPSSPGKGFWTVKPGLGGVFYFDAGKTWSASALAQYEIHTRQKDTGTTPGNHLHVEWGIGKRLMQIFTVGAVGYASWQTTADRGDKARNAKSRVFAAGGELGVIIPGPKLALTVRSLWEFGGRSTSEGSMTVFALNKSF